MLAHSWHDARIDEIRSPQAWLVTTTTRLCIDRLKQLRADQTDFPQGTDGRRVLDVYVVMNPEKLVGVKVAH